MPEARYFNNPILNEVQCGVVDALRVDACRRHATIPAGSSIVACLRHAALLRCRHTPHCASLRYAYVGLLGFRAFSTRGVKGCALAFTEDALAKRVKLVFHDDSDNQFLDGRDEIYEPENPDKTYAI